ncbi:large ribosomal subunit protein uL10-like [Myotis daubentonii]|uniref:large ribosomal subunit protein uL10-like n=1 Tax=Myotis daubentonii TaxID=98922 RepID=UPI0028735F07|nr:large ribosomal subunit protein uL10-like [Myotis daubentonii]
MHGKRVTSKSNYFLKIIHLQDDYPKGFTVGAANVGSKQMQQIHMSLHGKAVALMGKNTMKLEAIRGPLENNPALENLWPDIQGSVGLVFTKEDLTEISDMLLANQVSAAACAEQQWKPRLQEDEWQTQRPTGTREEVIAL